MFVYVYDIKTNKRLFTIKDSKSITRLEPTEEFPSRVRIECKGEVCELDMAGRKLVAYVF